MATLQELRNRRMLGHYMSGLSLKDTGKLYGLTPHAVRVVVFKQWWKITGKWPDSYKDIRGEE